MILSYLGLRTSYARMSSNAWARPGSASFDVLGRLTSWTKEKEETREELCIFMCVLTTQRYIQGGHFYFPQCCMGQPAEAGGR